MLRCAWREPVSQKQLSDLNVCCARIDNKDFIRTSKQKRVDAALNMEKLNHVRKQWPSEDGESAREDVDRA